MFETASILVNILIVQNESRPNNGLQNVLTHNIMHSLTEHLFPLNKGGFYHTG